MNVGAAMTENFHGIKTPVPREVLGRERGWWLLARHRILAYLRVKKGLNRPVRCYWKTLVSWYVRKHADEIILHKEESPLKALTRHISGRYDSEMSLAEFIGEMK